MDPYWSTGSCKMGLPVNRLPKNSMRCLFNSHHKNDHFGTFWDILRVQDLACATAASALRLLRGWLPGVKVCNTVLVVHQEANNALD